MKFLKLILISIVFTLPHLSISQSFSKENKELDQFVSEGMEMWKVPGMAVVVVKDGATIFKKSYGIRDMNTREKVDDQTLFAMGSTTKAITAIALGMLVDEGKIDWNDRVTDHLPYFQLSDPYITGDARIRDLLTHRLGLGNADFLWIGANFSTEEVVRRMKYAPIAYSLRDGYIYQNIMYAAAGEVIQAASGQSWDEFFRERIFDPIGMTGTQATWEEALKAGNHVSPHYPFESGTKVNSYMTADLIGAAGSVMSSADDVAKWVNFLLDRARVGTDTLLSQATYTELFTPQHLIPRTSFYPTTRLTHPNWTSYGLGWFQQDYKGHKVDFHTGSLPGVIAICGLMHDQNLGVYVFGNMDHAEMRHAVMLKVFDLYALGGERDWNQEIFDMYAGFNEQNKEYWTEKEEKRVTGTKTTLPLADYSGVYFHEMWGSIEVKPEGEGIQVIMNDYLKANFNHWHYDTFIAKEEEMWGIRYTINFSLDSDGNINGFRSGDDFFEKVDTE